MIKQCFIDTETTGTDPMRCGIWDVGGIIRMGELEQKFSFRCDIFDDDLIMPEALEMQNMKERDLSQLPDPTEAYRSLTEVFGQAVDKFNKDDKMFFIGYGAEFDYKILRRWFEGMGDKYFGSWFWMPWIDVMSLAAHDVMMKGHRHKLQNFKLVTVLEYYNIEKEDDKLHGALYDAIKTMQLYDTIMAGRRGMTRPTETTKTGKRIYRMRG